MCSGSCHYANAEPEKSHPIPLYAQQGPSTATCSNCLADSRSTGVHPCNHILNICFSLHSYCAWSSCRCSHRVCCPCSCCCWCCLCINALCCRWLCWHRASQLWQLKAWQLHHIVWRWEVVQHEHLCIILHVSQEAKPVDDQAWAVPVSVGAVLPLKLAAVCALITKAGLAVNPVH